VSRRNSNPSDRAAPASPTAWRRIDPLAPAGYLLLVLIWQGLSLVVPAFLLPSPASVLARLAEDFFSAPDLAFYGLDNASLFNSMVYSGENVLVAVMFGGALGTLVGLVTGRFAVMRAMLDPVMMTAGTVPILVAAPFLLIWFGVGRGSSVALVTFYVAVILYLAEILGGLRIALAGSWGLEAIAELLGAQRGIGKVIEVLAGATEVRGILACLLLLGVVAVLVDALAGVGFARLSAWSMKARIGGAAEA
jgi:ABC-type nitrate/sulfonate/bicarbonate transport system permease component